MGRYCNMMGGVSYLVGVVYGASFFVVAPEEVEEAVVGALAVIGGGEGLGVEVREMD
jgi:hypothetical protein